MIKMDKKITFSQEEKALIWSRFVLPKKGTEDEADHFISYCEQFGMSPLLNDIVFNRFETKNGPVVQFIATRDGLLRLATQQSNYVGPPNAAVVKEGDEFEFLPSEGTVRHKFGPKRGKILGAYAILKHQRFNTVATFVDFEEYFKANSGLEKGKNGNANTWDKMPSAMIVKVAEVFVLKRQFPLGGIQTQEEMALEDMNVTVTELSSNTSTSDQVAETDNNPQQIPKETSSKEEGEQPSKNNVEAANSNTQQLKVILKAFELKDAPSGTAYGICDVVESDTNKLMTVMVKGKEEIAALEKLSTETLINVSIYKENGFTFLEEFDQASDDTTDSEQKAVDSSASINKEQHEKQPEDNDNFRVLQGIVQQKQSGQKGQNKFVKMSFKKTDGETLPLLAHGDANVDKATNLPENEQISIKVKEENGFQFFLGLDQEVQKVG